MALDDIVFSDGDVQNFEMYMNRGNTGTVSDVSTEADSNAGILVNELPQIVDTTATVAYTWVG